MLAAEHQKTLDEGPSIPPASTPAAAEVAASTPAAAAAAAAESQPKKATTTITSTTTNSATIMSRNTSRPVRKMPAFSISMPEREVVANHVQNKDTNTPPSGTAMGGLRRIQMTQAPNLCDQCSRPTGTAGSSTSHQQAQHQNGSSSSRSLTPSTSGASPTVPISFGLRGSSSNNTNNKHMNNPIVTPTGYHEHTFGTSPFNATRLLPLLYLGNEGDAGMPHELLHRGIRRVLNVAFDCATQDYSSLGIQVLHVPLRDCGDEDIGSHFDRCCKWIHEGIAKGEGVIVHCRLGVSRSATIAIAYLMTYGISSPTRILSLQHRYRVIPIAEQKPQGQCRTCAKHHRVWHHYEDNAERINRCEFHTHPEEGDPSKGELYTDYGDVFTYVSMRREHISPNIGFAMQLRKLNVLHGFRDFLCEMSPGPSDDFCHPDALLCGGSDGTCSTATGGTIGTPTSCAAGGGMPTACCSSTPSCSDGAAALATQKQQHCLLEQQHCMSSPHTGGVASTIGMGITPSTIRTPSTAAGGGGIAAEEFAIREGLLDHHFRPLALRSAVSISSAGCSNARASLEVEGGGEVSGAVGSCSGGPSSLVHLVPHTAVV